jgi:hypothetical protein
LAEPPKALRRAGVEYVDDPQAADIIISRQGRSFLPYRSLPKRFVIWTHEPRYDLHFRSPVFAFGVRQPIHIMNIHTGDVVADNYLFMGQGGEPPDRDRCLRDFASKPWRAAMIATFIRKRNWLHGVLSRRRARRDMRASLVPHGNGSLILNSRNQDLYQRRQALALQLQRKGFCDIYGRQWPPNVKISGESRGDGWQGTKRDILKAYAVNIAFENTIVPHYVTEKIWDAIRNSCLPVYYGAGNRIYDDFPSGSFVEAADKTTAALADEIMHLGRSEAADRYQICLDTYLRIVREGRHRRSADALRERTAAFLVSVMQYPVARR